MNTSARSEVLSETDQVKEHCGNPGVDTVPRRSCPEEQIPRQNPGEPSVPDERASESFVGGAGI